MTLAAMSLLAGCAVNRDAEKFSAIAAQLDANGSFYTVVGSRTLLNRIGFYRERFENGTAASGLSAADRIAVRRTMAAWEQFLNFSGLPSSGGLGASSVMMPGGMFRNRIFLEMPENVQDAFSGLFSNSVDAGLAEIIASLPPETIGALGMNLTPGRFLKALCSNGQSGDSLLALLPSWLPPELWDDASGWYLIAFARRRGFAPEEDMFKLMLPDREGKIFALLQRLAGADKQPGAGNRIVLKPLMGVVPQIVYRNGQLTLYSSAEAETFFTVRNGGSLAGTPEFAALSRGIDLKGKAFFYTTARQKIWQFALERFWNGVRFSYPVSRAEFGVLSREKGGWLWTENSSADLTEQSLDMLLSFLCRVPDKPEEPSGEKSGKELRKEPDSAECRRQMTAVFDAVKKYRQEHDGAWPENLEGLPGAEKWNKTLRYTGAVSEKYASAVYPLLLDAPDKHADLFCVMFADGRFAEYKLVRPGSCRRMISFLYTVFRWENKLFQHLIRQAEKLDQCVDENGIKDRDDNADPKK